MRLRASSIALLAALIALTPTVVAVGTSVAVASPPTYTPVGTPNVDSITGFAASGTAPWNTSQGDSATPPYATGLLFPYTPGGSATSGSGATALPNLAIYPGSTSGTDGNSPYPSGTVGTPGPLDGYCGTGNNAAEAPASVNRQPSGTTLPFSPYYFPHVVQTPGSPSTQDLTGYFDYRPKDADEAIVGATSTDGGNSWTFGGEGLEQNPSYCPNADVNDDGEGHPFAMTIGGSTYLYTLERSAGDNVGVGLMVHQLTPTASNPINGVPATEKTGIDPDGFTTGAVAVGSTAATIPLTQTPGSGAGASLATSGPQLLVAGPFVDLTQTPVPTQNSVISCTGVGASSLTGCTTALAGGISVHVGDLIEQVIAKVTSNLKFSAAATACASGSSTPTGSGGGSLPCNVPAGPNTTTGDGGLEGFGIAATTSNNLTMGIFNLNAPNRAYIDGVAVYCNQSNALPTTKIENCTTGPNGPTTLTVSLNDPVTSDPILPSSATAVTTGLTAPDGIVGVVPSYPGAPAGSTVVLYTEKILNYDIVGYTTNSKAATFSTGITIAAYPNSASAGLSSSGPVTVQIGDSTTGSIVTETCASYVPATGVMSSCTGAAGGDTYPSNAYVAVTAGCAAPQSILGPTGEGSTKSSAAQKLWANNEDLTVLQAAYTFNGIDFDPVASGGAAVLANNGVISGNNTGGSAYNDINNPSQTTSPASLNAYATPGTPDATEMRFVGSGGTVLNESGTYDLFLSGSWCGDGDSDAYNQIFYATSTDGQHWSEPSSVISTDYTFSASQAQEAALNGSPLQDNPLGTSAYYSGRAYGPSVVENPDGSLTMVFAGYRLPKPVPTAGAALGTNSSALYTVESSDPALYRNILTVQLGGDGSPVLPEAPAAALLPLAAILTIGAAAYVRRRRRLTAARRT